MIEVLVSDPLGRKINAQYGVLGNTKTAIVEMSVASGITLLSKEELNPLYTSTYGTGQIIHKALDDGFNEFIVCIGGSATNDGGTGMAQALGIKFLDNNHQEISKNMCGDLLDSVSQIDSSNLHQNIRVSNFKIASDVDIPLLGNRGCAKIFAPQKGASPLIVDQLEKKMKSFIEIAEKHYKDSFRNIKGAGAAGGLGAGLMMFLNAQMKSGIDLILDACDFTDRIKNADLIITGEGKIDKQSAYGKAISGVVRSANKFKIPVIAFAGKINDLDNPEELGLLEFHPICSNEIPIDESMQNAAILLEQKVEQVISNYYIKT
jgi:glycerate kinase